MGMAVGVGQSNKVEGPVRPKLNHPCDRQHARVLGRAFRRYGEREYLLVALIILAAIREAQICCR